MKGHIEKNPVQSRVWEKGDHGAVDYALSRTYRILDSRRNREKADCKICGKEVPKGHGFHVVVATISWPKDAYLCFACFVPCRNAAEVFPVTYDGQIPPWWKDLDVPLGSPVVKSIAAEKEKAMRVEVEQREQQQQGGQTGRRG